MHNNNAHKKHVQHTHRLRPLLTVVHVVRGNEGVVDGHDVDVLVVLGSSHHQPVLLHVVCAFVHICEQSCVDFVCICVCVRVYTVVSYSSTAVVLLLFGGNGMLCVVVSGAKMMQS